MLLLPNTDLERNRGVDGFFADFDHLVTLDRWTTIVADGGTVTVPDGAPSHLLLNPTDTVDEEEVYVHTSAPMFKMADNLPIVVECRLQYAEANTSAANIIFGIKNAVAADALQSASGGPAANYNGACFFKVDGETLWRVESSITTTQTTSETKYTAGGTSYQTLRIEINNVSATKMRVQFFIDTAGGQNFEQCRVTGKTNALIDHEITLGTALDMDVFVGVKQGSTTVENLLVDYIGAHQKRYV